MPGRLAGKIALISGGSTGMGGASSRLFAAEGAKVGIVDLNEEAGRAVVAEIRAAGGTAMFAKADVADEAQVNAAVAAVTAELGTVNVLFNHAGSIIIKPFLETTLKELRGSLGDLRRMAERAPPAATPAAVDSLAKQIGGLEERIAALAAVAQPLAASSLAGLLAHAGTAGRTRPLPRTRWTPLARGVHRRTK